MSMISKLLLWGKWFIPLLVFLLPDFQTFYEEDIVLFLMFIILSLRLLNKKRFILSVQLTQSLYLIALGIVYCIGWIGFLRGYLDEYGYYCAVYPLYFVILVLLCPTRPLNSGFLKPFLWMCFFLHVFIVVPLFLFLDDFLFYTDKPNIYVIPLLLTITIISCLAFFVSGFPALKRGKDHLFLFFIISFVTVAIWSDNIDTIIKWYRAGMYERAWTPYKYDSPDDIASANRQPLLAANLYQQVKKKLQDKGSIPNTYNWPFYMDVRTSIQFIRLNQPLQALFYLPIHAEYSYSHLMRIKSLWHQDALWSMQHSEPNLNHSTGIWMDIEQHPTNSYLYTLDRWGRVYSIQNDICKLEWEPSVLVSNAIDLEIIHETLFVVLLDSNEIITSTSIPYLPEKIELDDDLDRTIDIEFFSQEGAISVSERGRINFWGEVPEEFPDGKHLQFSRNVIVDFEFDPDKQGYYLLDKYGAVHGNHIDQSPSLPYTNPPVPNSLLPYWGKQSMAVDLEIDIEKKGLCVYNRLGELYTIAVKPYRTTYRPSKPYQYRGVGFVIQQKGTLQLLESNGAIVTVSASAK
jgi:hypothetical protein